jgi:hypothetical protein
MRITGGTRGAEGRGIYDLASLLEGGPSGSALRGAAFADAVRAMRRLHSGDSEFVTKQSAER